MRPTEGPGSICEAAKKSADTTLSIHSWCVDRAAPESWEPDCGDEVEAARGKLTPKVEARRTMTGATAKGVSVLGLIASGSLRGPRCAHSRPAISATRPSLKPRLACCLRGRQRIWRGLRAPPAPSDTTLSATPSRARADCDSRLGERSLIPSKRERGRQLSRPAPTGCRRPPPASAPVPATEAGPPTAGRFGKLSGNPQEGSSPGQLRPAIADLRPPPLEVPRHDSGPTFGRPLSKTRWDSAELGQLLK